MKTKMSHKGWFLLCPIYIDLDAGDCPGVEVRAEWLEWWFDLNIDLFDLSVRVIQMFDQEYEPEFMFYVTGRVNGEDDLPPIN